MTITVKCFTESVKDAIVADYQSKLKLVTIARLWNTSTRTIGRILEERGLATPVPRLKGEAYNVMKLLAAHNLNLVDLTKMLDGKTLLPKANVITPATVQNYLNQCTRSQLAGFFYISGLVKLSEIANKAVAIKETTDAANQSTFEFAAA